MFPKSFLLTFLLITGIYSVSFSQSDINSEGTISIDKVRVYEQVVAEGYGTPFIYKELAIAYYFRSNYGKAVVWFRKLFSEKGNNVDTDLFQKYNQALKAIEVSKS